MNYEEMIDFEILCKLMVIIAFNCLWLVSAGHVAQDRKENGSTG